MRLSQPTRRDVMTRTAAGVAGLAALGLPDSLWAVQDGEEPVTFTDYTDAFKIEASANRPRVRCVDLRKLTVWTTPNDEHYTYTQTFVPDGRCRQLPPAHRRLRRAADGAHARPAEGPARPARRGGDARVLGQLHPAAADVRACSRTACGPASA